MKRNQEYMDSAIPISTATPRLMPVFAAMVVVLASLPAGRESPGASVPWTTYEAESMTVSGGTILGPAYGPNVVASESSARECVQLSGTGQYIEFTATSAANAVVVRYCVPDTPNGAGTNYTLSLYLNGVLAAKLPMTSVYSWLYGNYPFTNHPSAGSPRNFYDEVRSSGLEIQAGDMVRLQKDSSDTAAYYDIDLVDLENLAAPLPQPDNSLSIMSYGAGGAGTTDDTTPLVNCIAAASAQGKSVWLPPGTYKITSAINLPSDTTIQGAGMWYTTLIGDTVWYANPSRRVALKGNGSNIHLADFAMVGKLNYRNDREPNDGMVGSYGTGSTFARLWVEHTKTGAWFQNSRGLVAEGCRFRDTIADGINLNYGMQNTVVTNCTARGTGDDAFAMWPGGTAGTYPHRDNVITHCTAGTPFLANGGAIYGGADNRIEDCRFQDITYGCGILFSTTFPVGTNIFSGTTVARDCDLVRCGGYDPGYQWRAALQFCLDTYGGGISGVRLDHLNITDSISDGLSVIGGAGVLTNALAVSVNIPNYGLGAGGRNGLWARSDAIGSMIVSNSTVIEYRNDSSRFLFNFVTNDTPSPQLISAISVSGGSIVTLTYDTTPDHAYHLESTVNLDPPVWTTVAGSATNATGTSVTFTDPNQLYDPQRYYRTTSP